MATTYEVHVQQHGEAWVLSGPGAEGFGLLNDYLGYLADRRYSPRTIRAYAFDLLHFVRWLLVECLRLEQVTTDVLLGYLAACRVQTLPGRPGSRGDNVFSIRDGRNTGLAPATINRRLTAISGLFAYRSMRDPAAPNPVPSGRQARAAVAAERAGLLGHLARAVCGRQRPAPRPAAVAGGAADGVSLPPPACRRAGRPPARAAAQLRHRAGRGWRRPGRAQGADGPRPRRLGRRLHPPRPHPPARRLRPGPRPPTHHRHRCRPPPPACVSRPPSCWAPTRPGLRAAAGAAAPTPSPPARFLRAGPTRRPGPPSRWRCASARGAAPGRC